MQINTITVPSTLERDHQRVEQQIDVLSSTWNCRRITCCAASWLACPLTWSMFSALDCAICLVNSTVDPRDRGEPCTITRGACEDCCSEDEPVLPNTTRDICLQVLNPAVGLMRLSSEHYSTAPERQSMEDLRQEKRDLTLQEHVQTSEISSLILGYEGEL